MIGPLPTMTLVLCLIGHQPIRAFLPIALIYLPISENQQIKTAI